MRSLAIASLALALTTAAVADDPPQVALRQVAAGLTFPVSIAHTTDSRLFIVEQTGRILIFDGTHVLPTPFLEVQRLISCCGERGLLGLAFHPDYAANGRFFIYYTMPNGDIAIWRYNVSADPNRADPASGVKLLQITHQQFANHNGGQLQFGPDGYLYIGVGDGGSGGDPNGNGQNTGVLLAKLLRIDVNGALPYAIPPSNPFFRRSDARKEIWAYGLRNPWRFSFDRQNGDLWIADVGQDLWEEVDLQPATSVGGENYGWRRMEGTHCFNPVSNCTDASITLPILEYGHDNDACSVTGGYRYRGLQYPRLRGMFLYADYCTGVISGASQQSDGRWVTRTLLNAHFNISTFGEDAVGEVYVADYNGKIYQVTDTLPFPVKRHAARH